MREQLIFLQSDFLYFLDADTECCQGSDVTWNERDRDLNDEISVPSPVATREEPPVNFDLVICN